MHHSLPAEHAQHDLDLIAGDAAGDLDDAERTRADALLASCSACTELRRDLLAIAAATRNLPAPPTPDRNFRLTEAQAASLRRGGWIKSVLRPFAAPHSTLRPVAMAFTSLGLAGLLVSNVLPSLFGSAASLAPQAGAGGGLPVPAATAAGVPVASGGAVVPVAGGPFPTGSGGRQLSGGGSQPTFVADNGGAQASAGTAPEVAVGGKNRSATSAPYSADGLTTRQRGGIAEGPNPIVIGSLVLLAIGVVLFGLRFLARRVR